MASPSTENSSRGGSSRGSSRGGRGGPGGRGRGGRGRGRGGTRTPSISSPVDLSSPTTPTNPDSASKKPVDDKPPSLLSRIDMKDVSSSPRSAKANAPSSPRSPVTSLSPVGDGTPPRGGGGSRGSRGRKNSAASNGPRSPKVTNVPSPLSRRPPVSNSPLASTTASPKATPPHLINVVDTASPKNSPSQLSKELEPSQLVEIRSSSVHPSPAPSPRPFTPMTTDWAEDEDGGSLPSLDDWGLPGVNTTSEAGDVKSQDQSSIAEPMGKLSLKTDVKNTRGKRSGSAPQPASGSPASTSPAFANVIPPTPVSARPGQAQGTSNTALQPSPLKPPTLGVPNLPSHPGRPLSRTSSPAPLNLTNDTRRSPSPAVLPGTHSPGLSPGLKPTSGGVALGVRSRPVSPAPDMGQFHPQASSSPRLGGNFNLAPSPNFASSEFNRSRPTSPAFQAAFNQDGSQPGSRQGSPKGRPRALSGGVPLGVAASDSANPAPVSPGFVERSKDLASSASWRQSPSSQPAPPVLLDSPIPPNGLPPKPEILPAQTRPNNPNGRGRGSGPRGGRGGRGGHRGGGEPARFDRYSSQNQPGSPYNSTSSEPQAESNNRSVPQDDSSGHTGPGSRSNGGGSPSSVTSNSSAGRGRGHTRSHSRPIIVASSALSRINATLGSPQRPPKASTTNESVPVTGP